MKSCIRNVLVTVNVTLVSDFNSYVRVYVANDVFCGYCLCGMFLVTK